MSGLGHAFLENVYDRTVNPGSAAEAAWQAMGERAVDDLPAGLRGRTSPFPAR